MNNQSHIPLILLALNSASDLEEKGILEGHFPGRKVKHVKGAWKGKEEDSYLIETDLYNQEDLEQARAICRVYDQEAFLYLDNQRNAYLYSKDDSDFNMGRHKGHFVTAGVYFAKQHGNYTFDPSTETYWVIH